ncbi:hypothetical protein EV702DRAFT_1071651 [Suillus placidus]|uniref:Uncharacterized protein n=1 Tax=Suillus placidus TaxID=48579 RepID=A0A9P7A318_9AGAM|nr:hypothetical protein EV702DRAFT_1071651 [Suillus placidus]
MAAMTSPCICSGLLACCDIRHNTTLYDVMLQGNFPCCQGINENASDIPVLRQECSYKISSVLTSIMSSTEAMSLTRAMIF